MSKSTAPLVNNDELQFQYENEDCGEVPTIEEEDLADVRDDIDLRSIGADTIAADLELQSIAVPDNVRLSDSDENSSYSPNVDDDIVYDVLESAQIRRKQMSYESTRKSCFATALFVTLVVGLSLAVIIPTSHKFEKGQLSDESNIDEINSKLDHEGTAYGFDEKEEFGPIEAISNDWRAGLVKHVINDTQVALEIPFPEVVANNLIDLKDGVFNRDSETPFFWQVPLSGSSVQSVMTGCLGLVLASSMGDMKNIQPEKLKVVKVGLQRYVNVNLGNQVGIDHAHELDLSTSGIVDVAVSHHFQYATRQLFDPDHKGRAFTMLRHPIERALSSFDIFTKNSKDEDIRSMKLNEYLNSEYAESNWLTRFLTNHRRDDLGHEQVDVAKEILRRKFLIGIYSRFAESMSRFETYFGWTITKPPGFVQADTICHVKMLAHTRDRDREDYLHIGGRVVQGDPSYNKLKELNKYDLELYWYAVELFDEQASFIENLRDMS